MQFAENGLERGPPGPQPLARARIVGSRDFGTQVRLRGSQHLAQIHRLLVGQLDSPSVSFGEGSTAV